MSLRDRDQLLGTVLQSPLGWRVRVIASDASRVRLDFGHGLRLWIAVDEFRRLVQDDVLTERAARLVPDASALTGAAS